MENVIRRLIVETIAEDKRPDLLAELDGDAERDDDGVLRDANGNRVTYNANGDRVAYDEKGNVVEPDDGGVDTTQAQVLSDYDDAADKEAFVDSLDPDERELLRDALDRRNQ